MPNLTPTYTEHIQALRLTDEEINQVWQQHFGKWRFGKKDDKGDMLVRTLEALLLDAQFDKLLRGLAEILDGPINVYRSPGTLYDTGFHTAINSVRDMLRQALAEPTEGISD